MGSIHVNIVRYRITATGIRIFVYNQHGRSVIVSAQGLEEFLPYQTTSITRVGQFTGPLCFNNPDRFFYLRSDGNARNAIYEQASRLINMHSPIVQLMISNDGSTEFVNQLPNVQGVKNLFVEGKTVEAERLDELFNKYRHLDSAIIDPEIVGIFYVNSEIYNVPNLLCAFSARLTVSILRYFTGQHLRLKNAKCDCWEIIAFLRKWMAGEAYTNLKTLSIQFSHDNNFDFTNIYHRFDLPRWGANRPHVYMYDIGVFGGRQKVRQIDCEYYYEVERESDKTLASLAMSFEYLCFFVWDKEQQL